MTTEKPDSDLAWEQAKRLLVGALFGVAAGLAVAGSIDQRVGGVVVLGAWPFAIVGLHRLGRAGSRRD